MRFTKSGIKNAMRGVRPRSCPSARYITRVNGVFYPLQQVVATTARRRLMARGPATTNRFLRRLSHQTYQPARWLFDAGFDIFDLKTGRRETPPTSGAA